MMTTNIIFFNFFYFGNFILKLYLYIFYLSSNTQLCQKKIKTKLNIYRMHNIKKTIYNTPSFLKKKIYSQT